MRNTMILATISVGTLASASSAQSFFVFQEETLYRMTMGGALEEFDLGRTMISSSFDQNGRLVGFDARRRAPEQNQPAYELLNPFGASPAVNQIGDGVGIAVSSLTFIDGRAIGVDVDNNLREFDPTTLDDMGIIGNLGFSANGLGYDAVNDILYAVDKNSDSLLTINYNDASSSTIGSLGLDIENAGAEFFNGVLYASVQNRSTGMLELGTIDTTTGMFSSMMAIASFPDPDLAREVVSLAVIPSPGTAALLGMAGLLVSRRRR